MKLFKSIDEKFNEIEENSFDNNLLELIFENGKLIRDEKLSEIRNRLLNR